MRNGAEQIFHPRASFTMRHPSAPSLARLHSQASSISATPVVSGALRPHSRLDDGVRAEIPSSSSVVLSPDDVGTVEIERTFTISHESPLLDVARAATAQVRLMNAKQRRVMRKTV